MERPQGLSFWQQEHMAMHTSHCCLLCFSASETVQAAAEAAGIGLGWDLGVQG